MRSEKKKKKSNPTSDLMTQMCAMCRYTLGKQHTQCRSPRRTLKVHEATVTGELNRTISQKPKTSCPPLDLKLCREPPCCHGSNAAPCRQLIAVKEQLPGPNTPKYQHTPLLQRGREDYSLVPARLPLEGHSSKLIQSKYLRLFKQRRQRGILINCSK